MEPDPRTSLHLPIARAPVGIGCPVGLVGRYQHPGALSGATQMLPPLWGHLGSSCITPAPLIHTGWGPGAKGENLLLHLSHYFEFLN